MSSFPSLHDALSSLLPHARGGHDWMLRQGIPGFGDGIDGDERRGDPARGPGMPDLDLDVDAVVRPQHHADGGNGSVRQNHGDPGGIPPHARAGMSDPLRGPATQPLAPAAQGQMEPPLLALARELQQLPPSVIRQLSDALANNPAALRELPARPEALAAALSRAGPESGQGMQAAPAEARRLAHDAEAAAPLPRGRDAEAVRDARQAGAIGFTADPRGAADARATALAEARQGTALEARPGWTGGLDPALAAGIAVRMPGASEAQSQPAGPSRADPPTAATQAPATAAAGSTQAPAAPSAPVQDAVQLPGPRAEASGSTADRATQAPGLAGLGGAAAGVTLAAIANPAGTTHAYAPDSAVRARGAQQARDRQRQGGDAPGDEAADGQPQERKQRKAPEHGRGPPEPRSGAAAAHPDAHASGSAVQTQGGIAAGGHTTGPVVHGARPADASHATTRPPDDTPETRLSRRRQWLYWSLILVTYGCLGLALATVSPDLFGLPIAAESLGAWRNALTATGLLTGLWAWLLARRMR